MVGASGFEPPASWSRTQHKSTDSASLNTEIRSQKRPQMVPMLVPKPQARGLALG